MDIQSRKLSFIQKFTLLKGEKHILKFEKLLIQALEEETTFKRLSLKELNKRIDKSLENSKNDEIIENNDLLTEINKWD